MNYWVVPSVTKRNDTDVVRTIANMTSDHIIKKVCDYYEVDSKFLYRKDRRRHVVDCRHTCFYLLRKYTRLSLSQIGQIFGQDHTTVIHGIQSFNDHYETEDGLKWDISQICQQL